MWMFPMALACGNTFVLKPSERDPSAPLMLAGLMSQAGLPDGCLNVVHGDKEAVDAILRTLMWPPSALSARPPSADTSTPRAVPTAKGAGAVRGEEPHDHHARRRHGPGRGRRHGRGLRLGRRALQAVSAVSGRRRRHRRQVRQATGAKGAGAQDRAVRRARVEMARSSPPRPRRASRAISTRARRTARGSSSTGAGCACRAMRTASSWAARFLTR